MGFKLEMGVRQNTSRVSAIMGGLVCFILGGFSVYILMGGGELIAGIPFLSRAANEFIGRAIAGFSGVFCFALGSYAFYEAWVLHREQSERRDSNGGL